ncbi:TRAP transporter TatT component family protein, partial [bacterium]|nr:TRAP transporter TatT component family protein [bacterium]
KQAAASMLLTLESFHQNHPKNKQLLTLLSRSYANYAFGFSEENMLRFKDNNDDKYKDSRERALRFYKRGRDYGLDALKQNHNFKAASEGSLDEFEVALQKFGKKQISTLFWTGFNWGGWINLNLDDPMEIIDLPRVQAIMNRVISLDETFYNGAAHTFFGVIAAARPTMLGGNPESAKKSFDRAIEITDGKYLMTKVLYAQFYAFQIQSRELFVSLLKEVIKAPDDLFPKQQLANQMAKTRAHLLMGKIDDYF